MMSQSEISIRLPILDLSEPVEPSFISSLSEACEEWGFFYVTNHGISKNLFEKLRFLSKLIFNCPVALKNKLGPSSSVKTYTPLFIASPFFESLLVAGPDFLASAKTSADQLFDQQGSEFSETVEEYGNAMVELSKRIVEILLRVLKDCDESKFYESEFSNCHGYLRSVNYSPPENVQEQEVEGLGMHTDMSCITIVHQDEIGGLQMRSKEGVWMDIEPCESSLVVNVGDLMQAWSNGRLRSSEHRVVLRRFVNRLSLAFFWCFENEKIVLAPDEIVGEGNLRLYKPFLCSDYLKFRESNEEGKFERVGYTVKDFAGLELKECD